MSSAQTWHRGLRRWAIRDGSGAGSGAVTALTARPTRTAEIEHFALELRHHPREPTAFTAPPRATAVKHLDKPYTVCMHCFVCCRGGCKWPLHIAMSDCPAYSVFPTSRLSFWALREMSRTSSCCLDLNSVCLLEPCLRRAISRRLRSAATGHDVRKPFTYSASRTGCCESIMTRRARARSLPPASRTPRLLGHAVAA